MNIDHLKDSKLFMKRLMEVAVTPIFVVDENLVVQSYNDSFSTLFSKTENEIIGKLPGNSFGCIYALGEEECGKSENCIKCILRHQMEQAVNENKPTGRKVIEKEFIIDEDVVKKQLSVEIKPLDFDNEKFYIGIFNDVTDIMELEDQVYSQYDKMKRDLLFARGLQNSLLPDRNGIGPLRLSYIYRPCETLGGDFLDFYRIDRHNIGFIIADVAGHGITSSMFTMFLYSMINRTAESPARLLEDAFKEFAKFSIAPETYITMLCAVINTRRKTVTFANAGFTNPPAIARAGGVETIEIGGMPISNWVNDTDYEEITIPFRNGERLIFFSDGITEMRTESSSFIGGDYLYGALADLSADSQELINGIFADSAGDGSYMVNDDITIALVDF